MVVKTPSNRWAGLAAALLSFVLGCAGTDGGGGDGGGDLSLPSPEDVRGIDASLGPGRRPAARGRGAGIPESQWPAVLDALSGATPEPRPADWRYLGTFTIRSGDGPDTTVMLYDARGNPFSVKRGDGEKHYYRGADTRRLVAIAASAGPGVAAGPNATDPHVQSLGPIHRYNENPYLIPPYLRMAGRLQAMDEPGRVRLLKQWAETREYDEQVIILCRMLFAARPGGRFEAAALGAPDFLGGTTAADWPLEPIAVFEGVPFLVVRGYDQSGEMLPVIEYVEYCLKNCRWSDVRYEAIPHDRLTEILDRFVAAGPWRRPLTPPEVDYLRGQLRAAREERDRNKPDGE